MHSEHDFDNDRGARPIFCEESPEEAAGRSASNRELENGERRRSEFDEESDDWLLGPSGMIVLFLKHVHLQNVGAASWSQGQLLPKTFLPCQGGGLQLAETRANKVANISAMSCVRAILVSCSTHGF